jgi:hypothetical protein
MPRATSPTGPFSVFAGVNEALSKKRSIVRCIFCGSPKLTGEHIFSRWCHKYLAPRPKEKSLAFRGRQYPNGDHRTVVRKMPGQLRDWKVYCVCGGTHLSCNGGWMKAIEDRVRPILIPIILGNDVRIWAADQSIIATWATLKAIVAEYDDQTPVTVHHAQRRYIMKHGLPPAKGWSVWIGYFEKTSWIPEWVSRPMLLLPDGVVAKRRSREATYFNSCASTQIIGKLFVHVIHSPHPRLFDRFTFNLPQGALFRIWPPSEVSIKWPAPPLNDFAAEIASEAVGKMVLEAGRRRLAGEKSS